MQETPAIEAQGLVKTFGDVRAVDGVDLAVARGSVYGVLGPNGAGKTTTIRMLATLLRPDGGTARVLGHDIVAEADAVRRAVSLTGQLASVDEDLTGRENLILLGPLLGLARGAAKARAAELLDAFGLEEAAGRLVKNFSGGMRRRLDIAASIVVTPRADVPRRADHRPGPALAQPGVGHHPRAAEAGHDDPAVHAVPRGGRPARRRHRGHRPRHGHRRGHAGAAQGVGRLRRAARAAARPRAAARGRARSCAASSAPCTSSPTRPRCRRRAPTPTAARVAVAELARPGVRVADFSLGQPSLDEVFLALTGHTAEEQPTTTDAELEEAHGMTTHRRRRRSASALALDAAPPARPARSPRPWHFGWRGMLKVKHVPEQLLDVTITPVMFLLMFTYLFGGAIAGSTGAYLDYILPGIARDVGAVHDRLLRRRAEHGPDAGRRRPLPVAADLAPVAARRRAARRQRPLPGRRHGDHRAGRDPRLRPEAGVGGVVAALALVVVFAFGLSWVFTTLGLVLRSPNAVMNAGFMAIFPLTFLSQRLRRARHAARRRSSGS